MIDVVGLLQKEVLVILLQNPSDAFTINTFQPPALVYEITQIFQTIMKTGMCCKHCHNLSNYDTSKTIHFVQYKTTRFKDFADNLGGQE